MTYGWHFETMYSVIESKLASYSIARQPSSSQGSSLGLSQNPSSARAFIRHQTPHCHATRVLALTGALGL